MSQSRGGSRVDVSGRMDSKCNRANARDGRYMSVPIAVLELDN